MKEGTKAGAPNLEDLMPDDLRWGWWNHTRNKCLVTQRCPTLCSPPGSSVHWILQARILEWAVISFRRSSRPRDWTHISRTVGRLFTKGANRGKKNRNRVHNKWTALETSQNLLPPLSVKKLSSKKTPEVKEGTSSVLDCPRLLA